MTRRVKEGLFFDAPAVLSRGRHGLTRDQVITSQRLRLMAALVELMAHRGYAKTTIGEMATRAGVSRAAFYECFDDKEACLSAAYDTYIEVLLGRMAAAVTPDTDWHEFVAATLTGYLGTLEADPVVARAFLVEMDTAGPEARRRRRCTYHRFAELIKDRHEGMRAWDARLGPLPESFYLAMTHAVRELACDELERSESPQLTALVPAISHWITASIYGASTAAEELSGGRPARSASV